MAAGLTIGELKARATDFATLLGNDHDTTSPKIIGLLDEEFAVQHGEGKPSIGGRDAFLTNLGKRLELARGSVSIEVTQAIAEVYETGEIGGQCWLYSRKSTPLGVTDSVSFFFSFVFLRLIRRIFTRMARLTIGQNSSI